MMTDGSVPWYNLPPRPFPVHLWMQQRYGFRVPPLRFAAQASQPGQEGRRESPAKKWLREQQGRAWIGKDGECA